MSEQAILSVDGVRYGYGDLVAVWDVSFDAHAGKVVAILGRNGAGKTTTMLGLAGLLPTMQGSVRFDGAEVSAKPAYARAQEGLCLVPEGKRVFRDLTVKENLSVGLPPRLKRKERGQRIDAVCERFPILGEKRADLASTLSGGQQQLLAIGSALMSEPKVLLVDEPSSGLSPIAVTDVLSALADLKDEGLAIVLVEQRVEEVVTGVADLVILMESGRVQMSDIPERISLRELERQIAVGVPAVEADPPNRTSPKK